MNENTNFANELYFNSDIGLMANECERFGMTWGCREYCPVFECGECQIQEENKAIFSLSRLEDK